MRLTIKQYVDLVEMIKTADDSQIENIVIKYLKLEDLTLNELMDIMPSIREQLTSGVDLVLTFIKNGVEYGFIPNMEKMTTGEFIDLDSYLEQPFVNYNEIISVLYRPITKKKGDLYEIEKYNGTINNFDNDDYQIFLGAVFFFKILKLELLENLDFYIHQQLKSLQIEELE